MKQLFVLYTFLVFCLCEITLSAQDNKTFDADDLVLLSQHSPTNSQYADRVVKYGFKDKHKTINPLYHLLSSSMFVYQKYVSPVLSRSCAYVPTCSRYSKLLIKEYGLVKGTFFTADRLMRCNRIALADKNAMFLLIEGNGLIHEDVERYR